MKADPFPLPNGVPTTIIAELRAERRAIEEMLDPTPYISQQPAGLRIRRSTLCDEIERLEKQSDGGPLLTVTLDAYAKHPVIEETWHFFEDISQGWRPPKTSITGY